MLVYFSKLVITLNRGSNQIFYEARMPSYTGCTEVLPTCSVNRAILHSVPYIHQGHVNLCGDACLEMLKRFHDEPHMRATQTNSKSIESLSENPRKVFEGMTIDNLLLEAETCKFDLVELNFESNNISESDFPLFIAINSHRRPNINKP